MSKELLKRALEVIDQAEIYAENEDKAFALCQAIEAKLSKPEPEPVAWIEVGHPMDGPYDCHYMAILPKGKHHVYTTPPDQSAQIAELIAQRTMHEQIIKTAYDRCSELEQQLAELQAKRKPLTDEELDAMHKDRINLNFVTLREFRVIARAIEATHGINGVV